MTWSDMRNILVQLRVLLHVGILDYKKCKMYLGRAKI